MTEELLSALCLVLVLEGIFPFAAPGAWRKAMEQAGRMDDRSLRVLGGLSMALGLILLNLVR